MRVLVFVSMVLGWAGGRPIAEVVSYTAAAVVPELTGCVVLVVLARDARHARRSGGAEVLVLVRLAAELRAGATLRSAVVHIADSNEALAEAAALAGAGRPMRQVVQAAAPAMGRYAGITVSALRIAAETGGSIVPVVEQLVTEVMALDELARERRAAMAPVLLQSVIVGGIPLVTLLAMTLSGKLLSLAARGPWHAGMVLVGGALVVVGSSVVGRISWKAARW